jgi:hypothetical protein
MEDYLSNGWDYGNCFTLMSTVHSLAIYTNPRIFYLRGVLGVLGFSENCTLLLYL